MLGFAAIAELPLAAILTADQFDPSITTVYLSDKGFITTPSETPANTPFPARVIQPLAISRSILNEGLWGFINSSFGEIEIANPDGEYDAAASTFAIDGRRIVVRLLERGQTYADAVVQFDGTAANFIFDLDAVRIPVRDSGHKLDVPIQTTFYAGSGGAEGGSDLAGRPKPLAFGYVWNVEPVYLGVIGGKHTYQVHDGEIEDVPAARDRGVALTKVVGTPGSGQYSIDTSTGILTIGGNLPEQLTCDVEGAHDADGNFPVTTAAICRLILDDYTSLSNTELDGDAFTLLAGDEPGEIGIWIPDVRAVRDVVGELLTGIAAWGGFNRSGRFTVGRLTTPGGAIRAVLNSGNIIREGDRIQLERLPLPELLDPAVWRVAVGWRRNYTVQTDIASGAAEADAKFAAQEYRLAASADATVQLKHLLARDIFLPSNFKDEADATTKAAALQALFGDGAGLYRARAKNQSPLLDIGETVQIEYPRYGLDDGRLATIVAVSPDAQRNEVELIVFVGA